MDNRGIDQMLGELRAGAQVAASKAVTAPAKVSGVDFAQELKSAIDQVNQASQQAQQMAQDFSSDKPDTNLQDVMVNLQKANLSFQQMVQVRNKLVSAYQDIMNMSL
ncbi:MAG: flagellar hook-basal body complex protein FliE [Rhodocyclaceae bacterium]|nr:flagellar hook-basal body complex protein FliE [Rhodocyclaceae bacterium]